MKNFIKEKLSLGHPVIGIWSLIDSPMLIEVAARSGLDFQIFDLEHGVHDWGNLNHYINACEMTECSPLVRIPALDKATIQRCLDLGAHGIIAPQIKSYQEALNCVEYVKFFPSGSRGFNPFTRAGNYRSTQDLSETKLTNNFTLTSIIIENMESYHELDQILTIPELDVLYIGVYDLSCALGVAGQITHAKVLETVTSAIIKIKAMGKISGVMISSQSEMAHYLQLGARFIVYGVDTNIYRSAVQFGVNMFNTCIGQVK